MMDEGYTERLNRLTRQTRQIRPSPGFADRVMHAVQVEAAGDWWGHLLRTARWGFLFAALTAAASGVLALQTQSATRSHAASLFGMVQYSW